MRPHEPLDRCLHRAVGAPTKLQAPNGGSVVALALHCICVRAGLSTTPRQRGDPYQPPQNWDQGDNEWVFQYRHPGLPHTVVLHCSLQEATGRMYIQLREEGPSGGNIHPLGLTLDRYIPADVNFQKAQWADVMTQQDVLERQLEEFCIEPLLSEAVVPESTGWLSTCSASISKGYSNLQERGLLPHVAVGICGVAVVCAVVYWRAELRHRFNRDGAWRRGSFQPYVRPSGPSPGLKYLKVPK